MVTHPLPPTMSSPRQEPQIVEIIQCVPRPSRRWRPIPSSNFAPATEQLTEAELLQRNQLAEQLRDQPTRKRKRSADRGTRQYVLASATKAGDTERRAIFGGGRRGVVWETVPLPPTPQKTSTLKNRRANLPQIMGGTSRNPVMDGIPHPPAAPSPDSRIDRDFDAGSIEVPDFQPQSTTDQERSQLSTRPTNHQIVGFISSSCFLLLNLISNSGNGNFKKASMIDSISLSIFCCVPRHHPQIFRLVLEDTVVYVRRIRCVGGARIVLVGMLCVNLA